MESPSGDTLNPPGHSYITFLGWEARLDDLQGIIFNGSSKVPSDLSNSVILCKLFQPWPVKVFSASLRTLMVVNVLFF